ncbi:hypothetical protein C8R44DRAFT_886812 [Mycena epipterygia]|nr:hypothetical protein C8R44DRAFT_886812 [Mycena epipterygia]
MDLTTTLQEQGGLEDAEKFGGEVVVRMTESDSLRKDHPTTLRAHAMLATIYRRRGHLQGAETLGKEVLKKQSAALGEEHPQSLRSLASLGLTLQELGRLKDARELQEHALQGRRQVLGEGHPDTKENARELEKTVRELEETRKEISTKDSQAVTTDEKHSIIPAHAKSTNPKQEMKNNMAVHVPNALH